MWAFVHNSRGHNLLTAKSYRKKRIQDVKDIWLLGVFGFIHGIHEYIDLIILYRGENYYLLIIKSAF